MACIFKAWTRHCIDKGIHPKVATIGNQVIIDESLKTNQIESCGVYTRVTNEMALAFICHSFLSAPSGPPLRLPKLAATKEARPLVEALPIEVFEAYSDAQLRAACNLRVSTFNNIPKTYRIEEHQRFLSAIELEALKEKVEGKKLGFGKVTSVVATMPSKYLDSEKNLVLSKLSVATTPWSANSTCSLEHVETVLSNVVLRGVREYGMRT
ncbi:hypothetical protein L7F22_022645 [Adiantum nelumboides]|nr:hypothetical protein [Adiantum nelumboides]